MPRAAPKLLAHGDATPERLPECHIRPQVSRRMTRINTALSRMSSLAPLVLRLALGGLMAYHGFDKLRGGMDGVEEMFTMMEVPAPALSAPLVTALEIVGGIALIAGIGTRLAAAALAGVLAGALLFVKPTSASSRPVRCRAPSSTSRSSPA